MRRDGTAPRRLVRPFPPPSGMAGSGQVRFEGLVARIQFVDVWVYSLVDCVHE
jgi:hypothetical protein